MGGKKYQKVHWIICLGSATLQQSLGDCGHDILHQVVPQRKGACFKQLVLLLFHLSHVMFL